jgi:hypothetical protein
MGNTFYSGWWEDLKRPEEKKEGGNKNGNGPFGFIPNMIFIH